MKRYIIAGLLVWVPLGITLLVIKLVVELLDKTLLLLPAKYNPEVLLGIHIPGFGILLSAGVVLVTGMVVANFFGRQFVAAWENILARIPLVSKIYQGVKQIMETIFSSQGQSFRKVLLIEYPRKGIWTLAFQSSQEQGEAQFKTGRDDIINVFVPTTPNPTSGFFLMLPKSDVTELDMSIDEGLRMIISGGVVVPKWNQGNTPSIVNPGKNAKETAS